MYDNLKLLIGLVILSVLITGCVSTENGGTPTPVPSFTPTPTITPVTTTIPKTTTIPTTPIETPETPSNETDNLTTPSEFEYGKKYNVLVYRVINGDTIDVKISRDRIERLSLLGIDAPETVAVRNEPYKYDNITDLHCLESWGIRASGHTSTFTEGKYVSIEFDPEAGQQIGDQLTAYVYTDFKDLNAEMVELGLAKVNTSLDFEKKSEYLSYQESTREENIGLWSCRE